ncbi:hypothetical protein ACVME8_002476 [Bradyrhizobium diazoefficiens]
MRNRAHQSPPSSRTSEAQIRDPYPQGVVWRRLGVGAVPHTTPCGYGSRPSPGRHRGCGDVLQLNQNLGVARLQPAAHAHRRDPQREARCIVGLDRNAAERRHPRRRLEPAGGNPRREPAQRFFLLHADDGIVVAGHAGIRHVGGAAREDLVIGGRHMGVGADDEAGAAVAEEADALLLAARLAMEIDDDRIRCNAERTGAELALQRRKGIVERGHEDAAQSIDDERMLAVLGLDQRRAAAGRAARIVRGPHQAVGALDEHQGLALVPGVIAERHRVGAGIEKLLIDRFGDAEAAGGIFAVDDDEIERPVLDHVGQIFGDGRAPRTADDITHEENAQLQNSGNRTRPIRLAHNPARRRGIVPEPPRSPARQTQARCRRFAWSCASAQR